MTFTEENRAQRWHDTDHGRDRRPPRRSMFRRLRPEKVREWMSSCWCCCDVCDPDYEDRPNPYWSRAQAELRRG